MGCIYRFYRVRDIDDEVAFLKLFYPCVPLIQRSSVNEFLPLSERGVSSGGVYLSPGYILFFRSDIDVDDPAFWEKWAKKADVDVDAMNNKSELIMELPRQRKQTSRYTYGDQETFENMSELDSDSSDEDKKGERCYS